MSTPRSSTATSPIARHYAAMKAGRPELSPYYVAPAPATAFSSMTERQEASLVDRGFLPFA